MSMRITTGLKGALLGIVISFTVMLLILHMWGIQNIQNKSNTSEGHEVDHVTFEKLDEKLRQLNETLLRVESRDAKARRISTSFDYDDTLEQRRKNPPRKGEPYEFKIDNWRNGDKPKPEVIIIQPEKEVEKQRQYDSKTPIAWLIKDDKDDDLIHLRHVRRVLERLGYTCVSSTWLTEWDLAWGWSYPFWDTLDSQFYDLKPHQKVNHFPGVDFTIKSRLAKLSETKSYIPKAFTMPIAKQRFLKYVAKNPDTMWVKKGSQHKGVKIVKAREMNFTDTGSFLQQYIGNPLLIDERRFDFGLYFVVTSIEPLRVYILDEVNFRFCPEKYYPFNSSNVEKYVIKENYTPIWQMPSLRKLYSSLQYRTKATMDVYFRSKGIDTVSLWSKLYDTIVDILLDGEPRMVDRAQQYGSSRNFFELFRADFIMDDKVNFYLMEINMSPNLSPTSLPQLKPLFEHVLYNTFKLTGVARNTNSFIEKSHGDAVDMMVSDKDITVFPEWCGTESCQIGCTKEICRACLDCMSLDTRHSLKLAFQEHINRGTYVRAFPPSMDQSYAMTWTPNTASDLFKSLNSKNKLVYMWFVGMCQQHKQWCT